MRKYVSFILGMTLLGTFTLENKVFAQKSVHDCMEHQVCLTDLVVQEWEKEVIVEVANEEETLNYPMNPKYRYTFVWYTPSKSRAVCYSCGASAMGTVTRKSEWGIDDKECALAWGAGLYNDLFFTWYHYQRERCTSCGYSSEEWLDRISYTAECRNGDNPPSGQWEVREEYTPKAGYDPHQSLRWWLYKEQIY